MSVSAISSKDVHCRSLFAFFPRASACCGTELVSSGFFCYRIPSQIPRSAVARRDGACCTKCHPSNITPKGIMRVYLHGWVVCEYMCVCVCVNAVEYMESKFHHTMDTFGARVGSLPSFHARSRTRSTAVVAMRCRKSVERNRRD